MSEEYRGKSFDLTMPFFLLLDIWLRSIYWFWNDE